MDANILITAIWAGIVIGAIVSAVLTLMTLPASYLMNTFAYHHWSMRLVMMLAMFLPFIITATSLWLSAPMYIPWSLIVLVPNLLLLFTVFAWKRAHYYGLFPLYESSGKTTDATGFFASLFKFFLLAIHPIVMVTDTEAIRQSLGSLIVNDDALPPAQEIDGKSYRPGIVNEDFTRATMVAGKAEGDSWDATMKSLTEAATLIYGASPVTAPAAVEEEDNEAVVEEVANIEEESEEDKEKARQSAIRDRELARTAPIPVKDDSKYYDYNLEYIGSLTQVTDNTSGKEYTFSNGNKLKTGPDGLIELAVRNGKEMFRAVAKAPSPGDGLIWYKKDERLGKVIKRIVNRYNIDHATEYIVFDSGKAMASYINFRSETPTPENSSSPPETYDFTFKDYTGIYAKGLTHRKWYGLIKKLRDGTENIDINIGGFDRAIQKEDGTYTLRFSNNFSRESNFDTTKEFVEIEEWNYDTSH